MKKNILLLISLFVATFCFGQNVEVIQNEVRQTAYQNKSYLVIQSFTIQPPAGGGSFTVSAATHGPFYIKMYQPVLSTTPNIPPNSEQNYVRTETILQGGVTTEDQITNLKVSGKAVGFEYFDGLTRAIQSVSVSSSPMQKDLVQPVTYDANGRQSLQYLPYTANSQKGALRTTPLAEQASFYAASPKVSADGRPFSEITFENSPLNRVSQVRGEGDLWYNDARSAKVSYNVNSTSMPRWEINSSGLPVSVSSYTANAIYFDEAGDEDIGLKASYYDLRGLLIKSVETAGLLTTYYVYDEIGNLRFIIPPLLSSTLAPSQAQLDNLAFQYVYDSRQRLVKEKAPGPDNDWVFTIYDQWDRPVLTQDGLQRSKPTKEWSFVKYDAFNRPIITGVLQSNNTFDQMRVATTSGHHEDRISTSFGYTLTSSAPNFVSEANVLTVQYYDDYAFKDIVGWDAEGNNFSSESGLVYLASMKGQITGSKIKLLGQPHWLNSVIYYDKRYQAVETIEEHHLAGTDKYFNTYAFAGWVTQSRRVHTSSIASVTMVEDYEYDHVGRLLKTYHQIDNNPRVLLASNSYNELGQIVEINMHSTDNGASFLQSVDYRYNIRGWLTNINNSKLTVDASNDDTNDLFGMELTYNQAAININGTATTPLYNGTITAARWKIDNKKDVPTERAFGYSYNDKLWLSKANYASFNGTAYADEAGYYNLENVGYDANGNITRLQRYGKAGAARTKIDDLIYGYGANGNQLTNVEDAGTTAGFTNGTVGLPTEYLYDKNANVTADLNNSISSVTYNYINLPAQIVIDAAGASNDYTVEYLYDATGYAVRKVLKQGNGPNVLKQVDYVNGIQYVGGQLAYIFTPLGRANKNGNAYEYEYNLKDHLGNTRVTFGLLHEVNIYKASMESADAQQKTQEESDFLNVAARRTYTGTVNKTPPSANVPSPAYTALVKANTVSPNNTLGPAKLLTVKAGERVSMQTFAKTISGTAGNNAIIAGIAGIVANSFGVVNGGETQAAYTGFQNFLPGYSAGIVSGSSVPKAYICYILFNSTYTTAQFGFQAIDNNAFNQWQKLAVNITVPYDGNMYIYVASESTVSECYFDEIQIVHDKLAASMQVTASADYDPYGYLIEGTRYVNTGRLANNYLYQGDFSELDENTGWNRFELRGNYDSRLGRWHSADPYNQYASPFVGMGNMPINGIDPDGGMVSALAIAFTGATIGGIIGMFADTKNRARGAAIGFAAGFGAGYGLSKVDFSSAGKSLNNLYASLGDFIDNIDLSSKFLKFAKDAMSTVARRSAEESFVTSNYRNPKYLRLLRNDYTFKDNIFQTDPEYSRFAEPGYLNANYVLGSDTGPYKIKDPDTKELVQISRIFPKTNLDVNTISNLSFVSDQDNNAVLPGWGFHLYDRYSSLNQASYRPARLLVTFKTKKGAEKFYGRFYTNELEAKLSEMRTRYSKGK